MVRLRPEELTPRTISTLFADRNENTICLGFDGFEETCLGFLVHVRKTSDRYELVNITKEVELIVNGEEQLIEVIKHVSGIEYSDMAQRAFQQIRNDIGRGVPLGALSTAP